MEKISNEIKKYSYCLMNDNSCVDWKNIKKNNINDIKEIFVGMCPNKIIDKLEEYYEVGDNIFINLYAEEVDDICGDSHPDTHSDAYIEFYMTKKDFEEKQKKENEKEEKRIVLEELLKEAEEKKDKKEIIRLWKEMGGTPSWIYWEKLGMDI